MVQQLSSSAGGLGGGGFNRVEALIDAAASGKGLGLAISVCLTPASPGPVPMPYPNVGSKLPVGAIQKACFIAALSGALERAGKTQQFNLDAQIEDVFNSLSQLRQQKAALEQLRMQMAMDRMSKLMSTLSNLLKKVSDTSQSITQNIK